MNMLAWFCKTEMRSSMPNRPDEEYALNAPEEYLTVRIHICAAAA